ncbi:transposase DNA-binding-containing protein [Paludisphaera sp.]|uniref:IS4/Tn5 family transposase DNA-binding protein n=1 Tax=Paludisphaera sp. TaxID=2017432 RepID=UPI00301C6D3F
MGSWVDQELAGYEFADARLGKRFGILMGQLSRGIGRTIPLARGDWAATKAAYRFLDNDRVDEADILAGHFAATHERFAAVDGPVLVPRDTTESSFTREHAEAIGLTHKVAQGQIERPLVSAPPAHPEPGGSGEKYHRKAEITDRPPRTVMGDRGARSLKTWNRWDEREHAVASHEPRQPSRDQSRARRRMVGLPATMASPGGDREMHSKTTNEANSIFG